MKKSEPKKNVYYVMHTKNIYEKLATCFVSKEISINVKNDNIQIVFSQQHTIIFKINHKK